MMVVPVSQPPLAQAGATAPLSVQSRVPSLGVRSQVGGVAVRSQVMPLSAQPSDAIGGATVNACAPITCCCDPWHIQPGAQWPLDINWSTFLRSVEGFLGIQKIRPAALTDLNVYPPVPADPLKIALVSGLPVDPDPPAQPGYTQIMAGNTVTRNVVKVDASVPIGQTYRFDITAVARNCDGVEIVVNYCVNIIITQC